MVIYKYITPGQGQSNLWSHFLNHKDSVNLQIYCKFCPSNDIVTIFPIQMHGQPKLTLRGKRSRSSQGYDLYKLCRASLLDASCQDSKS